MKVWSSKTLKLVQSTFRGQPWSSHHVESLFRVLIVKFMVQCQCLDLCDGVLQPLWGAVAFWLVIFTCCRQCWETVLISPHVLVGSLLSLLFYVQKCNTVPNIVNLPPIWIGPISNLTEWEQPPKMHSTSFQGILLWSYQRSTHTHHSCSITCFRLLDKRPLTHNDPHFGTLLSFAAAHWPQWSDNSSMWLQDCN